jgi:poly-beta-1,6-N-acetyl-D-glucosamine synthase
VKYVIVTPVRDGERFVEETLRSVIAQQHRPMEWVIVDDGSTDRTPEMVRAAAAEHEWIRVIRRDDRGFYLRGPGVVDAVKTGLEALTVTGYDALVKLDADLRFGPDFFTLLMDALDKEPRLGMVGGRGYQIPFLGVRIRGDWPSTTVFGGTRCYRRDCYEQIDGIDRAWGWDAIDEARAQALGWGTMTLDAAEFDHLKTQNTRNKYEHGRSAYVMGTSPLYALLRAAFRLKDWPFVIGGFAFGIGYLGAWIRGIERAGTPEERIELRRQQGLRLRERFRQLVPMRQRDAD